MADWKVAVLPEDAAVNRATREVGWEQHVGDKHEKQACG